MQETNKKEDSLGDINIGKDSVFNLEAQKEIVAYSAKVRTQQAIKSILIILPIVGIFVFVLLYVVFKFVGLV